MPVTPLVTVTRSRVIGTPRAIRAPGGSIGYTRGRSPWMVDLDAIMFGAVRSAFPLESAAVTPADVDRVGGTGGRDTTPPSDPDTNGPGHDFAHLVAEHSAAVYRLARSVVRDPGLADDVTQDTFIKVWKHVDEFRGEGSMRGWILRIAHNTAVSTLRKIRDSATDPAKLPDAHETITPNRVVEGRLALDELREALDGLDELTRAVVVLREVEGMSYDDIATTLDVPIPTVKTRLLRGRRRLATLLEGWRA